MPFRILYTCIRVCILYTRLLYVISYTPTNDLIWPMFKYTRLYTVYEPPHIRTSAYTNLRVYEPPLHPLAYLTSEALNSWMHFLLSISCVYLQPLLREWTSQKVVNFPPKFSITIMANFRVIRVKVVAPEKPLYVNTFPKIPWCRFYYLHCLKIISVLI